MVPNKGSGSLLLRGCKRLFLAIFIAVSFSFATVFWNVAYYEPGAVVKADVAIVLGAAAWGSKPSPVYRERINEAIRLYQEGLVYRLIFTGGNRRPGDKSEGQVASDYAISKGVPPWLVLEDTESESTLANLIAAKKIMQTANLKSAIIVSDRLHLRRAMWLAADLGMDVQAVGTPTSRLQSLPVQIAFAWRETLHSIRYWLLQSKLERNFFKEFEDER